MDLGLNSDRARFLQIFQKWIIGSSYDSNLDDKLK